MRTQTAYDAEGLRICIWRAFWQKRAKKNCFSAVPERTRSARKCLRAGHPQRRRHAPGTPYLQAAPRQTHTPRGWVPVGTYTSRRSCGILHTASAYRAHALHNLQPGRGGWVHTFGHPARPTVSRVANCPPRGAPGRQQSCSFVGDRLDEVGAAPPARPSAAEHLPEPPSEMESQEPRRRAQRCQTLQRARRMTHM